MDRTNFQQQNTIYQKVTIISQFAWMIWSRSTVVSKHLQSYWTARTDLMKSSSIWSPQVSKPKIWSFRILTATFCHAQKKPSSISGNTKKRRTRWSYWTMIWNVLFTEINRDLVNYIFILKTYEICQVKLRFTLLPISSSYFSTFLSIYLFPRRKTSIQVGI